MYVSLSEKRKKDFKVVSSYGTILHVGKPPRATEERYTDSRQ